MAVIPDQFFVKGSTNTLRNTAINLTTSAIRIQYATNIVSVPCGNNFHLTGIFIHFNLHRQLRQIRTTRHHPS